MDALRRARRRRPLTICRAAAPRARRGKVMRYHPRVLKQGDRAPSFSANTTDGRIVRLDDLRGRPVVLFFFPKAFTFG